MTIALITGAFRGLHGCGVFAVVRVPRLVMVSSGMGPLTLPSTDEVDGSIAHLSYPASTTAVIAW